MREALESLRRRRAGVLLLNLAYFLALLAVGALAFFGSPAAWALIAVCVAAYLLAVRPATRRYTAAARGAILEHAVCAGVADFQYSPGEGVPAGAVRASGLLADNSGKAFMSREHVTGRAEGLELELADVTFPIVEDGRNAMFSGSCVLLRCPGAELPDVTVQKGELEGLGLPGAQTRLLEELGALIPGSLYLRAEGERLTLLLRGRFLGFRINPLMRINEATLGVNPFPELAQALRLARLMRRRS